jgi:hypothetical protein
MDFFLRVRFDTGSRKMVRGLGTRISPISTFSTNVTFLSQVVVAAIEVGRVNVADIM